MKKPLKLKTLLQKYDVVFCPPVNSSGDVYHIGAYLILCRTLAVNVPLVALFYDSDGTKIQAKRSKGFLAGLGFTNVRVVEIEEPNGTRFKTRAIPAAELAKSYGEHPIDQKATTSLLSFAILEYGNSILDSIHQHIYDICLKKNMRPAFEWVMDRKREAEAKLAISKNNFVIISIRHSKDANSEQDFPIAQLTVIAKLLATYNIRMVLLDVGGFIGKIFSAKHTKDIYAKSTAISVFPEIPELRSRYTKFPHLCLLQEFAKMPTCLGVIGNTSGTLDIAPLMGIHTLCIHKFNLGKKNELIIPYQDMRILLQSQFMSVYDFELGLETLEEFLLIWLQTKLNIVCDSRTSDSLIRLEGSVKKKSKDKKNQFAATHADRACFAYDLNDTNHTDPNKAFLAQYKSVKADQSLSGYTLSRLALVHNTAAPSIPVPISAGYPRDDLDLKQAVRPRNRKASF